MSLLRRLLPRENVTKNVRFSGHSIVLPLLTFTYCRFKSTFSMTESTQTATDLSRSCPNTESVPNAALLIHDETKELSESTNNNNNRPEKKSTCNSSVDQFTSDSHLYEDTLESAMTSIRSHIDPSSRFLLGYTCRICTHRSYKSISKLAYEKGLVMVLCKKCNNKHLIVDHIGWFKHATD